MNDFDIIYAFIACFLFAYEWVDTVDFFHTYPRRY